MQLLASSESILHNRTLNRKRLKRNRRDFFRRTGKVLEEVFGLKDTENREPEKGRKCPPKVKSVWTVIQGSDKVGFEKI